MPYSTRRELLTATGWPKGYLKPEKALSVAGNSKDKAKRKAAKKARKQNRKK